MTNKEMFKLILETNDLDYVGIVKRITEEDGRVEIMTQFFSKDDPRLEHIKEHVEYAYDDNLCFTSRNNSSIKIIAVDGRKNINDFYKYLYKGISKLEIGDILKDA